MLISAVQQSNTHIYILFYILFHYGLLQDIEYSSLWYRNNSRTLLFIHSVYNSLHLLTPNSQSNPPQHPLPLGNHMSVLYQTTDFLLMSPRLPHCAHLGTDIFRLTLNQTLFYTGHFIVHSKSSPCPVTLRLTLTLSSKYSQGRSLPSPASSPRLRVATWRAPLWIWAVSHHFCLSWALEQAWLCVLT